MSAAGLQTMEAGGAMRLLDGVGRLDVDRLAGVIRAGVVDARSARAERLERVRLEVQVERAEEQEEA